MLWMAFVIASTTPVLILFSMYCHNSWCKIFTHFLSQTNFLWIDFTTHLEFIKLWLILAWQSQTIYDIPLFFLAWLIFFNIIIFFLWIIINIQLNFIFYSNLEGNNGSISETVKWKWKGSYFRNPGIKIQNNINKLNIS